MNYPVQALMTGLRSAIVTKISGRTVSTVPAKSDQYPYIWLSQPYMIENGPKGRFIYEIEVLIQVIHREQTSLSNFLSDMQKVHEIINNGSDITVSGYTVISTELVNTNQTVELDAIGRLDIGLIRAKFELK
jgi:hypothetical protein